MLTVLVVARKHTIFLKNLQPLRDLQNSNELFIPVRCQNRCNMCESKRAIQKV